MEWLDILTPDGVATGASKLKADVHRDGDWHRASHLWIVQHDGRVLLQKRAAMKENWPGKWDVSVAGHISAGEDPIDAAVREASEEIGLTVDPRELVHIGTVREQCVLNEGTYLDNEIHEIFLLRRDVDLAALQLDASEVDEVALAALDELAAFDLVSHPEDYALLRRHLQTC